MSEQGKNIWKLFHEILSVRRLYWSFIGFWVLMLLIISGFIFIYLHYLMQRTESIVVNEKGAIVWNFHHKATASYLLSANGGNSSTPWINTGIEIKSADNMVFTVSGKVCTAIHHMVEAATRNTMLPPISWNGPEGIGENLGVASRAKDSIRQKYLIFKGKNQDFNYQGRIIGIISRETPPARPDSSQIIDVPEFSKGNPYHSPTTGTLWLTVNEVWLDMGLLKAVGSRGLDMKKAEYNFIVKNKYSNVWYDDNSGCFSVIVEIEQ